MKNKKEKKQEIVDVRDLKEADESLADLSLELNRLHILKAEYTDAYSMIREKFLVRLNELKLTTNTDGYSKSDFYIGIDDRKLNAYESSKKSMDVLMLRKNLLNAGVDPATIKYCIEAAMKTSNKFWVVEIG